MTSKIVVDDIDQVLGGLYDQNASIRGLILYKLPRYVTKYQDAGKFIEAAVAHAGTDARGKPSVLATVAAVAASVNGWQEEIGNKVVSLGGDPSKMSEAAAIAVSERASVLFTEFRRAADAARTEIKRWSEEAEADEAQANALLRIILAGGALVSLTMTLVAWFWLRRTIAAPVSAMTALMSRLAAGDNSVVVPLVGRGDEIGQIAGALESFKQAALEKGRFEAAAAEARQSADRERDANEALQTRSAQDQAVVMTAVASGLERLSQGDLVFRLETPFRTGYEKLRHDFNDALAKLQQTMRVVSTNTDAIRSGSGEISTATQDLSRRTEQQAASLEQTAAALEQITTMIGKTAGSVLHVREVVGNATADVEASGVVVRHAVEAMAGIETSSRQIGQIIGVVDEIAFQTNLLALNAGVEAARAGDAGRGFAVVASEVRGLAQRSAEAAKEIKALVTTSETHVGRGVELVGETGQFLGRIAGQIGGLNAVVGEIAARSQEQSTALQQVNVAIAQMDQVTQQNAAMVEETTAASRGLAEETGELAKLIGGFKVDGSVRFDARERQAVPTSATSPALKTLGRGGAALKSDVAPEEGWTEF
ncbi:methyl-accepting chemotaxis protein [Lichenifustis flavocetrariae]|uniref:HAMP domain-containing methyl-accepting chemotaxis protein n=1 Tax=Lichenifustis flavocetrariae TaxID=2949735 RepID=A0AA41Z138_9HYPH|nr:HAMP domain-containing methyl-accepting chemotaxis protein [Lichenifustis flavocetrariae]MCW6511036.1 HAMP domain-containing methyl-accepting chemotaxis protein [Lichenifustis flavocetrariae]